MTLSVSATNLLVVNQRLQLTNKFIASAGWSEVKAMHIAHTFRQFTPTNWSFSLSLSLSVCRAFCTSFLSLLSLSFSLLQAARYTSLLIGQRNRLQKIVGVLPSPSFACITITITITTITTIIIVIKSSSDDTSVASARVTPSTRVPQKEKKVTSLWPFKEDRSNQLSSSFFLQKVVLHWQNKYIQTQKQASRIWPVPVLLAFEKLLLLKEK